MAYTFVQEAHELSYTSASNTTIISNYAGPWSSDGISTYTGVTPSESQFATIEIDAMSFAPLIVPLDTSVKFTPVIEELMIVCGELVGVNSSPPGGV